MIKLNVVFDKIYDFMLKNDDVFDILKHEYNHDISNYNNGILDDFHLPRQIRPIYDRVWNEDNIIDCLSLLNTVEHIATGYVFHKYSDNDDICNDDMPKNVQELLNNDVRKVISGGCSINDLSIVKFFEKSNDIDSLILFQRLIERFS